MDNGNTYTPMTKEELFMEIRNSIIPVGGVACVITKELGIIPVNKYLEISYKGEIEKANMINVNQKLKGGTNNEE